MKTKFKAIVTALCAVLLVVVSVLGTMAYLTSQDKVTNTFTVGNVKIILDEKDVDGSTTSTTTSGRDRGNSYKLIPGTTYEKDPTVHVDANSESCWIFVKLENELKDIIDDTTVENQMVAKGWVLIDSTNNIYAYKDIKAAGSSQVVFDNFKIKSDADLDGYEDKEIVITAYAVQAENFTTNTAAWAAANFS